jgi:hypothetical protein
MPNYRNTTLEDTLAFDMRAVGLPEPVREYKALKEKHFGNKVRRFE